MFLAAGSYFLVVFGAGFLLGVLRELLLAPRCGAQLASLCEMPLMLTVIVFSARWLSRSFPMQSSGEALQVGLLALLMLLMAEVGLGRLLRGASLREIMAAHDNLAGRIYYLSLLVFGFLPWVIQVQG